MDINGRVVLQAAHLRQVLRTVRTIARLMSWAGMVNTFVQDLDLDANCKMTTHMSSLKMTNVLLAAHSR